MTYRRETTANTRITPVRTIAVESIPELRRESDSGAHSAGHSGSYASASERIVPPIANEIATPRRPGTGVWIFLLIIGTLGALGHVGVRFKGLEVAYALGRERKIGAEAEEQRRRLQIEIGMLKDPGRVISIARDKLKMGPPPAEAIRRLGSGKLFTGVAPLPLPAPATAEKTNSIVRPPAATRPTTTARPTTAQPASPHPIVPHAPTPHTTSTAARGQPR